MNLVPQLARMALVSLALTGFSGAAFAAAIIAPGNGNSITLPAILVPSVQSAVLPAQDASGLSLLGQKMGVQDGHFDFFSVRPSDSGDFKPMFRGGFGEGGLKLQLKW